MIVLFFKLFVFKFYLILLIFPNTSHIILNKKGRSDAEIKKIIEQEKETIRKLHSMFWSKGVRKYTKIRSLKTTVKI